MFQQKFVTSLASSCWRVLQYLRALVLGGLVNKKLQICVLADSTIQYHSDIKLFDLSSPIQLWWLKIGLIEINSSYRYTFSLLNVKTGGNKHYQTLGVCWFYRLSYGIATVMEKNHDLCAVQVIKIAKHLQLWFERVYLLSKRGNFQTFLKIFIHWTISNNFDIISGINTSRPKSLLIFLSLEIILFIFRCQIVSFRIWSLHVCHWSKNELNRIAIEILPKLSLIVKTG